jgi:hypothetical protein
VRTIVAPEYCARTAASTFALVVPVSGVSPGPRPPWPPGPLPPRGPRSAWTEVAVNEAFTSTTFWAPAGVLTCAW